MCLYEPPMPTAEYPVAPPETMRRLRDATAAHDYDTLL